MCKNFREEFYAIILYMKKTLLIILLILFLSPMIAISSEETDDYVDMAASYAAEGEYQKAMQSIDNALRLEPNNKTILNIKSTLHSVMYPNSYKAQSPSAIRNFSGEDSYLQSGLNQYEMKDFNGALYSFQKYLEVNPNSDFTYTMIAKCYLEANNPALALNYIEKALRLSNSVENRMIQGKILYAKGNYIQAKKIFEDLKFTVQTSELYEYIGLCNYKMGNFSQALMNIDKAIILRDDATSLNILYNEIKQNLEVKN